MEINDIDVIIHQHAEHILDSKDLFVLSNRLRVFLTWLKGEKEKNKKFIALYRALKAQSFDYNLPKAKYEILHGKEAVREYLFGAWMPCKYYKDNLTLLENSIAYIEKHFVAPEGKIIITDKIDNLMSSVDKHFQFSDKVLKKNLPILLLDHSHIDYNSFLVQNLYIPNEFRINMLYIKNSEVTGEQVFLHELGHVLHVQLTGSLEKIPDGFMRAMNLLCQGTIRPDSSIYQELFADFFVLACTWFDPTVPTYGYDTAPNNHREIFAKYYKYLIDSIG